MSNLATSTLVLGTTGSGKSTLVKSITDLSPLDVYVIGGGARDYNPNKYHHLTYEEFEEYEKDINNCNLIFEDIVKPSDVHNRIIYKCLVQNKRHQNINCFFNAHSIEKNNIHSLMPHFDYVIFTNAEKNDTVFNTFVTKFVKKDIAESNSFWKLFRTQEKTTYLRYNNVNKVFEIIDVKGNILQNPNNKLRNDLERYLSSFGNTKIALSFFDFLLKRFEPNLVSPDDFILVIEADKNKKLEINIIDLVYFVTQKELERAPPKEIVQAYKILQKLYKLPVCFIGNKHFE